MVSTALAIGYAWDDAQPPRGTAHYCYHFVELREGYCFLGLSRIFRECELVWLQGSMSKWILRH